MKEFIKKISVTILSLIVLMSSMSFTIDKHFCGETLVDVSFFGEAGGCGMEGMKMNSEVAKVKKKKCCKNVTETIESSTFDKEKIINVKASSIAFAIFFLESYINNYQNVDIEKEIF